MAATSTTFRDMPRTHIVLVRLGGSLVASQRGPVDHQANDRSPPLAAQCPLIRGRGIKCQQGCPPTVPNAGCFAD